MKKRYAVKMINKNGYTISHSENSIDAVKNFARFYPMDSFFGWIYDNVTDQMLFQNIYGKTWKKCSNETFVPYY